MTVIPETLSNLQGLRQAPPSQNPTQDFRDPAPEPFNRAWVDLDLPDHTQLPESDGTFVKNFQEHPQSILLTDSLTPVLQQLHPDGNYAIGQDSGIYWRSTDPPERGSEAPDWFYVPDVPPLLDGDYRRSYVLAREQQIPLVILEFASGDGSEERDNTPLVQGESGQVTKPGKLWVYEQVLRTPYYGIYEVQTNKLEVYQLEAVPNANTWHYCKLLPNAQGRYAIPPLQVELGVWQGSYQNQTMNWMRWWNRQGELLLTGTERAAQAELALQRSEAARHQAELAQVRAIRKLSQMGLSPEQIAASLGVAIDLVHPVLMSDRGD
jgi:Uma2 family endonuclease